MYWRSKKICPGSTDDAASRIYGYKGKLYPGMRHEILNEREKEKVYHDVKKYIEKKLNI